MKQDELKEIFLHNPELEQYINEYLNTNYTYFCQIIKDRFGYTISDTTINRWLREKNIISPYARKKTKKQFKKLKKNQNN